MRLILVRIWRDNLPKYGRPITKFFLGTVLTTGLSAPWQIELNYAMFMLNSNKPIKVAYLQKLANESVLNGALVIEMVNNFFIES